MPLLEISHVEEKSSPSSAFHRAHPSGSTAGTRPQGNPDRHKGVFATLGAGARDSTAYKAARAASPGKTNADSNRRREFLASTITGSQIKGQARPGRVPDKQCWTAIADAPGARDKLAIAKWKRLSRKPA